MSVLLAATAGCSAVLDFHECDTSADCAGRVGDGGVALFCTADHMCVDPTPCSVSVQTTAPGAPLVVAGLYKLSGGDTDDHAIRHAGDLAAEQLGTLDRAVVHVVCDTAGDPAQAQTALRVAVEIFHAVAIIGPDTSDEVVKGIAPVVRRYGAVVVSPSATNPSIAQLDDGGLIWRTCPDDDLQAKVLATLVPTTARLDLVYVDMNTYATGLEQSFTQQWGGTLSKAIVFESGMAAEAVAQMDAPASALLVADVDAPALVAAIAADPSLAATQLLMTDSALAPSLWGAGPYDFAFLGHIAGTAPGLPMTGDPSAGVYRSFATDYTAHWGEDPADTAFVANAYDAFFAIALAAAASADDRPDGASIAANLGRLSSAGAAAIDVGPADFLTGMQALLGGSAVNLVGASGPIDFDSKTGDIVSAPIEIWTIGQGSDGQPTFVTERVVTP